MNKIPVLKIRDENGNFIPINAIRGEKGKDGVNGKSAYEQAQEGGYKGTEQEFIALINGLTAGEHAEHYANLDNPHQVTAQQVGALPITGGQLQGGLGLVGEGDANTSEIVQNSDFATIFRNKAGGIETILSLTNESKVDVADVLKLWFANGNGYSIYGEHNKPTASDVGAIPETYYVSGNLDIELQQGGDKMVVCCYTENTLNTPHKEGLTDCTHGMVITNAFNSQYGTQLSIPSGEDAIYVRRLNGSGISKWVNLSDNERVIPIEKGGTGATTAEKALQNLGACQIETGSYEGTGTVGVNSPNSITFDNIVPKIVWCFPSQMAMSNYSYGGSVLGMLSTQLLTTSYSSIKGFGQTDNGSHLEAKKSADGKTIYWYSTTSMTGNNGAAMQNNYTGTTYYYIGIG